MGLLFVIGKDAVNKTQNYPNAIHTRNYEHCFLILFTKYKVLFLKYSCAKIASHISEMSDLVHLFLLIWTKMEVVLREIKATAGSTAWFS